MSDEDNITPSCKQVKLHLPKNETTKGLEGEFLYTVSQRPPLHMIVLLAFQQALLSLSGSLAVSTFAAEAVCAGDDSNIRATLLSSTLFMNGITTLFMVTLGIRLPLYQGAAALYIVPLMALQTVNDDRCSHNATDLSLGNYNNLSIGRNSTLFVDAEEKEFIYTKLRQLSGCLILAGCVHCLLGVTGIIGFAMRAIGPVTVVPTVLLTGIYLCRASAKFSKVYWGISLPTAAVAIILSIYMRKIKLPIPVWTRKHGCHFTHYPVQQVFAILIAMLFGWMLSGILTETETLTDDPNNVEYKARTDARVGILRTANWFTLPYPGQFGLPSFDGGIFVAFLIATMVSILDSIGDYYACARICNVPPPPRHGVNRGIAIEGLCTALSGAVGCGHATSTQGGNIGAIGVTRINTTAVLDTPISFTILGVWATNIDGIFVRCAGSAVSYSVILVASRDVFLGVAIIYILFGIIGKFSAVFITMPYPVLGGGMIIMYGMFTGVILSNLEVLSLSSTRNLAIIGMSLLVGLMIPYWIETTKDLVFTGDKATDNVIKIIMANPNITGGLIACFLDNTAPGTKQERGIEAWQYKDAPTEMTKMYSEGMEVYDPLLPMSWLSSKIMKCIPFLPYKKRNSEENAHISLI